MTEITLRQLRYFDALAIHGRFGRAATACGISQPALSMQIKELEEVLGAALVERGARQARLTSFGEDAVLRVREILRSVDEMGDLARASRDRLAGRLRIGMIPTIAPYFLPTAIANIGRRHPELDIHVREALTSTLIQELLEGRLDAAVVALPVSEPSLAEVALFKDARCGCYCWKKDTVSAIKLCRSARCNLHCRVRRLTQAPYLRLSKWSAPAWA
jgi:LysR family hydrogen peroxide-inducible transcriptional activator